MIGQRKRVVLVQPRTGNWDHLGARLPESLLGIASLPAQEGYDVQIIDARVEPKWKERLEVLVREKPLIVGTTSMTGPQIKFAVEVSQLVRSCDKTVPILWGGLHPTMQPAQTIAHPLIDIVIVGEGEKTFLELIHALENGQDLSQIRGIVFKKGEKVIATPPREPVKHLDELPDLPYKLVDMKKYYAVNFRGRPSTILTTSRGCPYRCNFCMDPAVFKRRWQPHSPARVLKKMHHLVDTYRIKDFYFQDDNFATDLNRVKEILRGVVAEFDDIAWGTLGIRADAIVRMDEELLELFEKSGCRNIDVGAESGSQRMLDIMKKDEKVEAFVEANRKLAKYNIILKYTFVVGYPGETEEDLEQSRKLALQLIEENKNAYCAFFTFCPYLGTEAWDIAVKYGFKPPTTLEEWAAFDFDGWYEHNPAWLTKKRQKMIENINFTSYFANKNVKYKINTQLGRFLFDLYNPIAHFRFKYNFYHFQVERKLRDILLNAESA